VAYNLADTAKQWLAIVSGSISAGWRNGWRIGVCAAGLGNGNQLAAAKINDLSIG
jgi:hypothetical protein